jgi:hypothetical protein
MDGECSGHTSHDNGSPMDGGSRLETNLLVKQCHAHHGGQQAKARAQHPTTEQEAVPRQSKLADKQAATMVQPHAPPRHEPMLEMERILMVDFTSTQAQAKEEAPPASREEGQVEVTAAKPMSAAPPLTTDGVNNMYHQLAEIHAIVVAQLVECARWHWTDSTPSSTQAETNRPRLGTTPSMIRMAPSPSTDFSS